jgi:hypothetical protein
VTREFLTGEFPIPFDPNQSVLEVVETVQVDDAVVAGVRKLVEQGYTIALDDFTLGLHERLLEFATYVKIDLLDVGSRRGRRGGAPVSRLPARRADRRAAGDRGRSATGDGAGLHLLPGACSGPSARRVDADAVAGAGQPSAAAGWS